MKITVIRDVKLCTLNQHFGGIFCLHHQGKIKAKNDATKWIL
jgi:hypothetical protein